MRKQAEKFLTEVCVIERLMSSQGDFMTPANEWRVIAAGVKCRVITKGRSFASQIQIAAQETLADNYRLAVPLGTDLQADDRITVGSVSYSISKLETELTDEFFLQATLSRRRGTDNEST
jgi:hypothetical protein